jgi:endonuclease/exonuclease/phosphatase family metal-dependent hydrolase
VSPRLRDLLPAIGLGLALIGLAVYVGVSGLGSGGGGGGVVAPLPSSAVIAPVTPSPTAPTPTVTPTHRTPRPSTSAPSLPHCLAPVQIKMLTFNIHGGRHPDDTLDLARVEAEIKASGADIVLLQEVHDGMFVTDYVHEPEVLAKALGMYAAFGVNLVNQEPGGRPDGHYGTLILSRYPITSYTNTLLPHPAGQQRGLLHAIVSVAGIRLDVWNTHLENGSSTARLAQIRAAKELIGAVDGHNAHAMLFGGDLNASADSPAANVARRIGHDTWEEVGSGPGYTVPQAAPRNRIDYQFHNGWLVPVAAQVLPSAVSDHRSLWAAYDLYSQPSCA